MSPLKTIVGVVLVIALAVGVISYVQRSNPSVAGNYNLNIAYFNAGVKIGPALKTLSNFTFGTCNLVGPTTIPATSTRDFSCVATGVKSGDIVQISPPATQANGFTVLGASASTTNGYITVRMQNASTTGTTLPTNSTSTFQWEAFR